MRRTSLLTRILACATFVAAAAGLVEPSAVHAQTSVAPYFLVIFDNSGSMDASTGMGNNTCGQPRTRLNDARCVMQRVVNSYGDIVFGLERFRDGTTGDCALTCGGSTCGCSHSYLNCSSLDPFGQGCRDSGTNCRTDTDDAAMGEVIVPIQADNHPALLSWVDFTCGGTASCVPTAANPELEAATWTPLAGSLSAARDYFRGVDPRFPSPLTGDPYGTCRPVNVILLTDGEETCASDAATIAAATALHTTPLGSLTYNINTYAIGFGITQDGGDNHRDFEDIAHAGRPSVPAYPTAAAYYASDETTLAAAFAQIIADSVRVEVCDTVDNDCDTRIDEGFTLYCNRPSNPTANLCVDPGETLCDGIDNNCNGTTDEGLRNACGTCGPVPTEICNRLDDNCNGAIDEGGVCGSCTPNVEVCNNRDDDCDTRIDETLTRPCGTDTGECTAGTQICAAGTWGMCSGIGATTELCNNRDDDCDGVIDGMVSACGTDVGACQAGSQICTAGVTGPCIGAIGPATETCNAIDDDCNGTIDNGNPGGGGSCGSAVGVCRPGTLSCVGGMLTCTGGTSGSAESCNTRDDDCDGRTDEGNPGGGASCGATDVGACEFGTIRCLAGALTCTGTVGPTPERCNGLDDDCNGMIDDGTSDTGASCGDDLGECQTGVIACIGGTLTCSGEVGPAMETCNGLDDDCDGTVDDEIPVGAACGSDIGECDPGVVACDPSTGMTSCIGEVAPTDEVCNLLDDDCDGSTDEALPSGGACGTDDGVCMAGMLQCVDGAEICVGEVPAGTEICDCEDNDCDMNVDEDAAGSLCPGGTACIECGCASQCMETEFGFLCPGGRFPQMVGELCYCVQERCTETDCNGETQMDGSGAVVCAPDSTDVAPCTCRSNACTFACDGVVCAAGTVCNPRDPLGRCVEDNCRGLGCPDGEVCDFGTGACTTDPCLTAGCAADEACRDGTCVGSCAGVMCPSGSLCHDGACETDPCDGITCPSRQTCNPADGGCVADMCLGRVCGAGTVCDPVTGECNEDPCNRVTCPSMQTCVEGECVRPEDIPDAGPPMRDAGMGMDAGTRDPARVLATGGSLCSASPARSGAGVLGLLALVAVAVLRRRTVRSREEAAR